MTLEEVIEIIDTQCCYDELYKANDYIIAIQETDTECIGYDYTIFHATTGKEFDGGILEDEDEELTMEQAVESIASEYLQAKAEDIEQII